MPPRRAADVDERGEPDFFVPPHRTLPMEALIGPWFGYFAMLTLAAQALSFLSRAFVEFELIGVGMGGRGAFQAVHQAESWQAITSWVALPSFAIWFFLISRNARLLRADGISLSPSTILLIFCCPILNFIMIYINLQEVWRASDPRQIDGGEAWRRAPPSALIRLWGLNVLCAPVLIYAGFHIDGLRIDNGELSGWLFCIANLNIAGAGGLLIAIIYFLQARQQERYIRLYEDPD